MSQELPLFAHQKEAIEFIVSRNGSGMITHEPGLGKTRTAMNIFFRMKCKTPSLKLLVVCPLSLIEAAWHADLIKFFGEDAGKRFVNCHKEGVANQDKELWDADIFAVNYEFFQNEAKLVSFIGLIRNLDFMVVLDESSKIKNYKALTTKNLLAIRNYFKYRVVMSGTPAPNSEEEYWAQMEFAIPGLLGKSFPKFKRTYFYLSSRGGLVLQSEGLSRQAMAELFQRQGAEWRITADSRKKLFDVIGPHIHAAKKDECLDLPEQIDEIRLVQMGPKQRVAYKQMKNLLVAQIDGEDVVAQVALTKLMKLREITAGWAYSEDGTIVETECPKLVELEQILDELGDRQAIIWGQFTWEIEKIAAALELSAPTATLYGGTKDREDSINGFISGNYRYLVANPHSAAHGLTFVNCSHQIFFSLDYSWEAYEQARARTHRAGQKSTCVYYYILADGTIDQEILEVLRSKGRAQDLVFKLRDKS